MAIHFQLPLLPLACLHCSCHHIQQVRTSAQELLVVASGLLRHHNSLCSPLQQPSLLVHWPACDHACVTGASITEASQASQRVGNKDEFFLVTIFQVMYFVVEYWEASWHEHGRCRSLRCIHNGPDYMIKNFPTDWHHHNKAQHALQEASWREHVCCRGAGLCCAGSRGQGSAAAGPGSQETSGWAARLLDAAPGCKCPAQCSPTCCTTPLAPGLPLHRPV